MTLKVWAHTNLPDVKLYFWILILRYTRALYVQELLFNFKNNISTRFARRLFRNILRTILPETCVNDWLSSRLLNVTCAHGFPNIPVISSRDTERAQYFHCIAEENIWKFERRVWNSVICEVSSREGGESAEGQLFRIEVVGRDACWGTV